MKLVRRRRQTKRDQALDTLASAAKAWSEWQLAKNPTKAVSKGAQKAAKAGVLARAAPVKAIGALALAGGLGVIVARKLKGRGEPAPTYSPPVQPPAPVTPSAPPAATPGAPSPPVTPASTTSQPGGVDDT